MNVNNNNHNSNIYPNLLDMPDEMLKHIARYLDLKSGTSFMRTCNKLQNIWTDRNHNECVIANELGFCKNQGIPIRILTKTAHLEYISPTDSEYEEEDTDISLIEEEQEELEHRFPNPNLNNNTIDLSRGYSLSELRAFFPPSKEEEE